ncbi:MAG: DUF1343 domain-containing protein [Sphingobacteriia bacterium]|nr:MAG: DUF1343 domain-containing protein [Sphingobacteriia bacterium]
MKKCLVLLGFVCMGLVALAQVPILPAAHRTEVYLPLLKGKRVGVFANHTATIGKTHLVDSLVKRGIQVTIAFGPEHGFRGQADAGEKIDNYIDPATGIPVVSLYGKKRKPSAEDLKNVDVLLFDIQDVGTRFYTFISSLQEFMETAFEAGIPLMILDRPNPNGFYVDGPVLNREYSSFVGMQPIPVVYGMTMAEYAMMLAGEKWLSAKANERHDYYQRAQNSRDTAFHFQIIKCGNYTHKSRYVLPIAPSPNLPDMASVYQYASTCYFEGTVLSEGRGTEHPFCIFGHPDYVGQKNLVSFTPISRPGAAAPKLKDQACFGWNIYKDPSEMVKTFSGGIDISWLVNAYAQFPEKDKFFLAPKSGKDTDYFFNKLAGSNTLMQDLKAGKSASAIKAAWQADLNRFKQVRKKYLLYTDFE